MTTLTAVWSHDCGGGRGDDYDDTLIAVVSTKRGMIDAYYRRFYDDDTDSVYVLVRGSGRFDYTIYDGDEPTLGAIVRLCGSR